MVKKGKEMSPKRQRIAICHVDGIKDLYYNLCSHDQISINAKLKTGLGNGAWAIIL